MTGHCPLLYLLIVLYFCSYIPSIHNYCGFSNSLSSYSSGVIFFPAYLGFRKLLNVLFSCFFKFSEAQLKRKIRKKSRWYLGTITKRRRISQTKDDSQNTTDDKIEMDIEENHDTSVDHNETGNTGESSMEENEKQQNASEGKIELGSNNSNISNIENELEECRKSTACTELRKDKIACNGDALSSQIMDVSDEAKGKSFSIRLLPNFKRCFNSSS